MDGVMTGQPVEGGVENGAAGMGGHRPTGHMAPHVEIKLFVGRVPQSMEDTDLRPVFEEFGEVKEAIIIRDKATGKHKNSAFVKMGSIAAADAAIRGLNSTRILEQSMGPITVKYATGEAEKLGFATSSTEPGQDQAKLFIGSIPRTMTEDEVRMFFSTYGTVEEVFVMKDNVQNTGKGCCFVKYAYKEEALHAIRSLSGKHTFDKCSRPVEVRFAESKAARQQQMMHPAMGGGGPGGGMRGGPGRMGGGMGGGMGNVGAGGNMGVGMGGGNMGGGGGGMGGGGAPMGAAGMNNNSNPRAAGQWKEYFTQEGRPYYHNEYTNVTTWERPPEFYQLPPAPPQMAGAAAGGMGGGANPNVQGDGAFQAGPPGANIFVFHVPNEWSYYDLMQNFGGFGNVVSARVATDRTTGRNRGFAFVSYDSVEAAASAVNNMNGFMAGGKRLKVSVKKGEEQYVQHLLQPQPNPQGPRNGGGPGGMQQQWGGGGSGGYGQVPAYGGAGQQRFTPY